MSVAKIVLRNVAASWVGLASQIIVTLLLTPFVIQRLGTEAYGLWLLLQSMVGYYGLVDMGLRAGLTQSITRRIAAEDIDSVRRHIAAAVPLLSALGAVILTGGTILAISLPHFVEMSDQLVDVIWTVVMVQAVGAAIKMPITPYGAVLVGLQRYDIANAISVVTRIIFALATWWALSIGGGLVAISVVLMLTNCLDSLIRVWSATKLLPGIRNCGLTLDRSELKEIGSVGIWNFLIGVSRQFIYFSDAITVAILFSAKAVAPYGIAASIVQYGTSLVVTSTKVLFPTMTRLSKQGDIGALTGLYITATRMVLGLSLSMLIVGSAWIRPFLSLWLGDSEQSIQLVADVPAIFVMLSLAFMCVGIQRAGTQLLLAENKLKLVACFLFAEALINLVGSVIAGKLLGPIGIAIGTLIAAFIMGIGFHLPAHARLLKQSVPKLLIEIVWRPIVFGILLSIVLFTLVGTLGQIASFAWLCTAGILSVSSIALFCPILLSTNQLSDVRQRLRDFSRRRRSMIQS
ncbi:putative membrane protein EpsK [Planctomycetes bacterium CA13]|uniref:Putative membrane protein EpsK n=1 Tax=Novipirellula herctigrandis TaxID=2527986 RepID=A0A5C5Z2J7_9BACT|nr:putative membrane protein EpsK [Planctomycetes bacterium CA13]